MGLLNWQDAMAASAGCLGNASDKLDMTVLTEIVPKVSFHYIPVDSNSRHGSSPCEVSEAASCGSNQRRWSSRSGSSYR